MIKTNIKKKISNLFAITNKRKKKNESYKFEFWNLVSSLLDKRTVTLGDRNCS